MRKNILHLTAAVFLTLLVISLSLPLNVYSAKLFHTIQIASFTSEPDAQKQFDSIVNKLDEKQLDNLRIEKIGKFYSVRLGKFMDSESVDKFFKTVTSKLPNAAVMTAYIKKERIVKMYSGSGSVSIKESEDISFSDPVLDKAPAKKPIKAAKKVKEVTEKKAPVKKSSRQKPEKDTPQLTKKTDKKEMGASLEENIKNIEALVRKKEYDKAMEIIKAEITTHPKHPDLNAWYGMVLLKKDNPLEALEYLEQATKLSPNSPDYQNGLGYSLFFLDRFDEAINAFNKTISLDPGHFDALTGLCIAYAKNDNKDKAMEIYHKIKYIDTETSKKLLKIIKK